MNKKLIDNKKKGVIDSQRYFFDKLISDAGYFRNRIP